MKTTLVCIAAISMLLGCSAHSESPEEDESSASITDAERQADLDAYRSLDALSVSGSESGVPMFVSNNPESFSSTGLLATTASPPSGRSLRGTAGCVRHVGLFLAHYNKTTSSKRVHVIVSSPEAVDVTAKGAIETGAVTRDNVGRSPATAVVRSWLSDQSNVRGGHAAAYAPVSVASVVVQPNHIVEGRLDIQTSACAVIRVVATDTNADAAGALNVAQSRNASGNIVGPNGPNYGRPAGVYSSDAFVVQTPVAIDIRTSADDPKNPVGTQIDDPSQGFPAVAAYNDSDTRSTGNYGVDYRVAYAVANNSGRCLRVSAQLRSFQLPREVPSDYVPSRLWDGSAAVTKGSATTPTITHFSNTAGHRSSEIASGTLRAGASETWSLRIPVPGLTSIPAGIVFRWTPATCS